MAAENAKLDELRKSTARMLLKLYTTTNVLQHAIAVTPDLKTLRASRAVRDARAALDEFGRWMIEGAITEGESEALRRTLPRHVREDAEVR